MFSGAADIERYLLRRFVPRQIRREFVRSRLTPTSGVVDGINKIDAYLTFCEDLMVDGIVSNQSRNKANKVNARMDISINQPDVMPLGSNGVNCYKATLALSRPEFESVDKCNRGRASNGNSYELGGVSVSIGGEAAPMISVSPTAIAFYVPAELPGGLADVLVTTRDGYIMHSTASVNGLNPTILVSQDEPILQALFLTHLEFRRDGFSALTSWALGPDLQTRLSILATGLSYGTRQHESRQ